MLMAVFHFFVPLLTGLIPAPLYPSYSASKFALHGFFGSLRHDYHFQQMDISITEHIIGKYWA